MLTDTKIVQSGEFIYYLRKYHNFIIIAGWTGTWWCGQIIQIDRKIDPECFYEMFWDIHTNADKVYSIYETRMPSLFNAIRSMIPENFPTPDVYTSCLFCCSNHGDLNIGPDGVEYPKFISDVEIPHDETVICTQEYVFDKLTKLGDEMILQEQLNTITILQNKSCG